MDDQVTDMQARFICRVRDELRDRGMLGWIAVDEDYVAAMWREGLTAEAAARLLIRDEGYL